MASNGTGKAMPIVLATWTTGCRSRLLTQRKGELLSQKLLPAQILDIERDERREVPVEHHRNLLAAGQAEVTP